MGGASWHRRRVVETEGVYVELALGRWGNAIVVGVVLCFRKLKTKIKMTKKGVAGQLELQLKLLADQIA